MRRKWRKHADVSVRIDLAKLHCPRYNHPLKPPIFPFLCDAGDLACSNCHAQLPKDKCYACGHDGAYRRNTTLEESGCSFVGQGGAERDDGDGGAKLRGARRGWRRCPWLCIARCFMGPPPRSTSAFASTRCGHE
ncbi:unnamed protein product [Urochloa humidicola]